MLWPAVAPFQITCCVLVCALLIVTLAAPRWKFRRLPTFLVTVGVCMFAFVPVCGGIMSVMDAYRFGVFEYDTCSEVNDMRVERYLPPAATKITVDKYASGFRARFTISQDEFDAFMDRVWDKYGDRSVSPREDPSERQVADPGAYEIRFKGLDWQPLPDAVEQYGPRAPNGAGFSIWFSSSEGVAYQRMGYW